MFIPTLPKLFLMFLECVSEEMKVLINSWLEGNKESHKGNLDRRFENISKQSNTNERSVCIAAHDSFRIFALIKSTVVRNVQIDFPAIVYMYLLCVLLNCMNFLQDLM